LRSMDEWRAKAIVRAMEACTIAIVKAKAIRPESDSVMEQVEHIIDELDGGIEHAISLTEM